MPHQWTVADSCVMVTWFKRPGDKPLPNTKLELLLRYNETCTRNDQVAPFPALDLALPTPPPPPPNELFVTGPMALVPLVLPLPLANELLVTGPMALIPLVPLPLPVANGLLTTCPMVPLVPPLPLAAETLVTGPRALVPLVVPQPLPPSPLL